MINNNLNANLRFKLEVVKLSSCKVIMLKVIKLKVESDKVAFQKKQAKNEEKIEVGFIKINNE